MNKDGEIPYEGYTIYTEEVTFNGETKYQAFVIVPYGVIGLPVSVPKNEKSEAVAEAQKMIDEIKDEERRSDV